MSAQLDILALEPFFGGVRKSMLETVIRCSRHRWTLLKLPPRRIERRLAAAAHWFAEQLSRHWVGRVDLLFTSEALNLADLYRLMPNLARKPSIVYFHSNQLPAVGTPDTTPADMVNLNTATAAHDLWFNSAYHRRTFLERAAALVERHPELSNRSPVAELARKSRLMPPPTDLNLASHVQATTGVTRDRRTIFAETRNADCTLLNSGLGKLQRRGEKFQLVTVGPVEDLSPDLPRTTIPEQEDFAIVKGMLQSGAIVSARPDAPWDHRTVIALSAGCWPIVPDAGVYPELIPDLLHGTCLYDVTPDHLASKVQDFWHLEPPDGYREAIQISLKRFNAIPACKAMDERIAELAAAHTPPPK